MHFALQLRVVGHVDLKSRRIYLGPERQLERTGSAFAVGSQTASRTRSGGYHTPDPGLGQSLVRERGGCGGARPRSMLSPPWRIGAVLSCPGWLSHSVLILYPEAGFRRQMFAVIGARIDPAVVVRWNAELARSKRKVGIARLASRSLERLFYCYVGEK